MTAPAVALRSYDQELLHRLLNQLQLDTLNGYDFAIARTLVAAIEHAAPRMNAIDRQQIGRLMIAGGHKIELSARSNEQR